MGRDGLPILTGSDQRIWRWHGSPDHQPGTFALGGDPAWQDVQISTRLRSGSDGALGVMFRYVDPDHYYRLALDYKAGAWALIKRVNGQVSRLAGQALSLKQDQSYELTLRAVGSQIYGQLDGTPLFTVTDRDLSVGRVGLYCRANAAAHFERVVVADHTRRLGRWTIYDEGDLDGPSVWRWGGRVLAQTSNIHSSAADGLGTYITAGYSSLTDLQLSTRLRSDGPGVVGVLFRYTDPNNYYGFWMDIQNSASRLVKRSAGQLTELWAKTGQGYKTGEVYTVHVIAAGGQIDVLVGDTSLGSITDADHPAGLVGLLCTGSTGAVFEDVEARALPVSRAYAGALLDERFDTLVPGRWSFVDFGNWMGPSQWQVTDGVLQQASNIRFLPLHFPPVDPGRPATVALAGEPAWKDYRFSVELGSNLMLGATPLQTGVVFRYTDADNFYWFSIVHINGNRALMRRLNGTTSVLWQGNGTNNLGQTYRLEIDCLGANLRGTLDGNLLFDVVDDPLPAGMIGLACTGNPAAYYNEAHVVPPVWKPDYTFLGEDPLPAGSRVRVHSGSRASAPAEIPGILFRFVTPPGRPENLQFSTDGVNLRLLSPGLQVEHARNFVSGYAPSPAQDWRILRKADGTGFILLRSSGGAIPRDLYRFAFTYHRDNRSNDPNSPVFSQAGNRDSEQVIIDFPWLLTNQNVLT